MHRINIYPKKTKNIFNNSSLYKYDPNIPVSRDDQLSTRFSMLIAQDVLKSFRTITRNMVYDMSLILDEKEEKHGKAKFTRNSK
jgi:hypothetical protein